MVRLRELLSNFPKQTERLLSAMKHGSRRPDAVEEHPLRTLTQPNHKLQPEEVDALVEAYLAGASMQSVANQFNVHRQTAKAHLVRRGVEIRPELRSLTAEQVDEAVQLYDAGWSTYRLAVTYRASPDAVRRALVGRGVVLRPRGHAAC